MPKDDTTRKTTHPTAKAFARPQHTPTPLGITPYFSRGTHPFEDISWERRDAYISGANPEAPPAFEQKDVSVPEFWSQNATNIVAQKYFSGQLGGEGREWSVKQLIGRVVERIGKEGLAAGYFVDDDERQLFEYELAYILAHQMAAFNSPVWFNIGVDGVDQQCSACQPYGALVSTPQGLVKIGELVDNDAVGKEVFDASGKTKIVATKANGSKEVLQIETRAGYRLEVTPDHSVWRATSAKGGKFVQAKELKAGDQLLWVRTQEPESSSEDIAAAALAGWLQGDGCVAQYDYGTNRSLTVEAISVNEEERQWVHTAIDKVFVGVHSHERNVVTQDKSLDCRRLRLYGEVLRPYINEWDLKKRGPEMEVPSQLFTAPLDMVTAYLQSLFQAEGYVSFNGTGDGGIGMDMVSEDLLRGVQQLLLRLGIYSRINFKSDNRENRKGCWALYIRTAKDRTAFAGRIGFIASGKTSRLKALLRSDGLTNSTSKRLEISSITSLGKQEVYDIQTESGEYLSNNIRIHNCFILAVEDDLDSILNWYREEGKIFQNGSGAGINLSPLRGSAEPLSRGGRSSGPVTFMRGADASAGTITSGGRTRRAAKMIILDADHPDIEDFIWCKADEEKKARALAAAGFDMSLNTDEGARNWASLQYQNANNSVRVSDEFLQAVASDGDWELVARSDGSTTRVVKARELMRQMAEAAHQCADPGVQYHTTINDWHTCPNFAPINASNPCFPASARVHTSKGIISIQELVDRGERGEEVEVYTDPKTANLEDRGMLKSLPVAFMRNGIEEITRLYFSNGQELRCTPNHRIWTQQGFVAAKDLTPSHRVVINNLKTPSYAASWLLPHKVQAQVKSCKRGAQVVYQSLPTKWSKQLAEIMGYMTGDGCVTDQSVVSVYGYDDIEDGTLAAHKEILTSLAGGCSEASMPNGTIQLRVGSEVFRTFLKKLGMSSAHAPFKRVPESIFQAPPEIQAAYLSGLFSADGCVARIENGGKATRYVGLASTSKELVQDVQKILSLFSLSGSIYETRSSEKESFPYTRKDGTEVTYLSKQMYDLRISGTDLDCYAQEVGFSSPRKQAALETLLASTGRYSSKKTVRLVKQEFDGREPVFNLTEPLHHSYIVDGFLVANCSEYLHVDNSSCNLASLNLMKFRNEDGSFNVDSFRHATKILFTAQEILIAFSDYPTEEIGDNTRAMRQIGIGYANLGALLMAEGLPYDSDDGRELAAAITSLMTGEAYRQSAVIASRVGAFDEYENNAEPMMRVLKKHRAAANRLPQQGDAAEVVKAARKAWKESVELCDVHGVRNAQASVLAPTGCLVADSLISSSRGLVRLRSLGNTEGAKWQPLDISVATDEGPRQATQFYVNGSEQVVSIETSRGYRIQGTPTHRIKVLDENGDTVWRRLGEITNDDQVPMTLGGIIGDTQEVVLPPLGDLHWNASSHTIVPRRMNAELAEFVGYFMGDGSLHAKGIRLCVFEDDQEVATRLVELGWNLFGLEAHLLSCEGYTEVAFHSVPLTIWWDACGFAKHLPHEGHSGKGWTPHIPDAILHSNDAEVYSAFTRGLFEADGNANNGYAYWNTTSEEFSRDVQTLLLALGFVTTRDIQDSRVKWGAPCHRLRLLNAASGARFVQEIGFMSERKNKGLMEADHPQAARYDRIPVSRALVDEIVPGNDRLCRIALMNLSRSGDIPRRSATELLERTQNPDLEHLLGYFYDSVTSTELLEDQSTFDLSVPDNLTYVANGFISHNTISFLMDCDTTGVEPDFSLVKLKQLVGGGTMTIVNQTVPHALSKLGYTPQETQEIVAYIREHGNIIDAPHLDLDHYPVFACAVGENAISYQGHLEMMAAVQPSISGAISKTVNLPASVTVEDIMEVYLDAGKKGLKAVAIYRDGTKTAQPLGEHKKEQEAEQIITSILGDDLLRGQRRRISLDRTVVGRHFRIGQISGYIHVGLFDDGTPGDLFVTVAQAGSALRGMIDAWSMTMSMALQYGCPLDSLVSKLAFTSFEPSGFTNDEEIRSAKSIVDYVARWMAARFLDEKTHAMLGIHRPAAETSGSIPAADTEALTTVAAEPEEEFVALVTPEEFAPSVRVSSQTKGIRQDKVKPISAGTAVCPRCGGMMVQSGKCMTCTSCGDTGGCG